MSDPYFEREVELAIGNLRAGYAHRHTLHSPIVLVAATQAIRAEDATWGARFKRDPRKFSSTPRRATAEQVSTFIQQSGRDQ